MPTYARADLAFEKGEGVYLFAADGRRYLDFASGVAVNALGHCHPRLVAALKTQADKLWHCSNLYRVPLQEKVAGRLCRHSFADTVFFCNSGAEAMEGVIKLMRKYHSHAGNPERWRVVVAEGAFHGRTLATLAAGGQEKHLKGFGPVMDGFDRVAFGNLDEMRRAIGPATAGILIEPVQGEGGVRAASPDYLRALRAIADEFGVLLAFDEVQTGNGRTGKLFAHEWAGITPDVLGTAKGLGGGFPLGAVLASEKAAAGMTAGTHGSTFGGNPLAMAVADAVLDELLSDGFLDHVQRMAEMLATAMDDLARRHPTIIEDRRGTGLLRGFKTRPLNGEVVEALAADGLLTVGAGDNVVRLVPPLVIEAAHIREAVEIMDRRFTSLAS
ncbi:MAG TPA: aspartate aminotransferase family protein [Rhodospirillaceae bacterium]|nr:aspartate aminotransferase family protein [Rhodospirillaceae bacterium]